MLSFSRLSVEGYKVIDDRRSRCVNYPVARKRGRTGKEHFKDLVSVIEPMHSAQDSQSTGSHRHCHNAQSK